MIKVLTKIITRGTIETEAREIKIKGGDKMKELKGTEKQVAWAKKIREEQIADFNRWKERWLAKWEQEGNKEEINFIKKLTKFIDEIDEASKWIEVYKSHSFFYTLLAPQKREAEMKHFEEIFGKNFLE